MRTPTGAFGNVMNAGQKSMKVERKDGSNFDITLDFDDKEYRVQGFRTKYYPATMYLANGDPGDPAEGGDLEDCQVWEGERKLPDDETDALMDDDIFYDAIQEAIEELE